MDEEIEIEVFESIQSVSRDEWDSVAGHTVGVNYTMLLCRERNYTGFGEPRYFLARAKGAAVAVSAALMCTRRDGRILVNRLFGRLASKARPTFGFLDRALVCGMIPGPGPAIVTRTDADQERWTRAICGAMEDYARLSRIQMAYVADASAPSHLSQELRRRRYLKGLDVPVSILDITWGDLDGYFDVLKKRKAIYGSKAKSEVRRFGRSGIEISRWRGGESTDLFDLLRTHNEDRTPGSFSFGPGFLEDLVAELGDDCIVYVARKVETLVGVCVALRRGDRAQMWLVGIDHAADGKNFTYFNLAFYHSCSDFPDLGIRHAYYGNAVQYAKYRRGCDVIDTNFYVKPRSLFLGLLLRPLFAIQKVFVRRKYRTQLRLGSGVPK